MRTIKWVTKHIQQESNCTIRILTHFKENRYSSTSISHLIWSYIQCHETFKTQVICGKQYDASLVTGSGLFHVVNKDRHRTITLKWNPATLKSLPQKLSYNWKTQHIAYKINFVLRTNNHQSFLSKGRVDKYIPSVTHCTRTTGYAVKHNKATRSWTERICSGCSHLNLYSIVFLLCGQKEVQFYEEWKKRNCNRT